MLACRPLAYRLALSILADPTEAEDAAQDALIAIVNALPSFRSDAAFTTWVYAIALNTCRKRLKRHFARERLLQAMQAIFALQHTEPHPEEVVIQLEGEALIAQAARALDEKHRLPLLLRYAHGLNVNEIAQILGINKNTVLSRLHTARERLRGVLTHKADAL